jgi:primase-polymerase (primpol)-like protein
MKKLALIFIFISSLSYSQESDLGNWLIYIGSKKIDSKWNIHNEVQYRNYDAISDLEQLLLRTGVGYNFSPNNNNLLIGYGFIRSENYNGNNEKSANNNIEFFNNLLPNKV